MRPLRTREMERFAAFCVERTNARAPAVLESCLCTRDRMLLITVMVLGSGERVTYTTPISDVIIWNEMQST